MSFNGLMMKKYLLLHLIAVGFFTKVPVANAESIIQNTKIQNTIIKNTNYHLENQTQQIENYLNDGNNLILKDEIVSSETNSEEIIKQLHISQRDKITVPAAKGKTIRDIQVRFVDKQGNPTKGKTKTDIILREFSLKPGDIYNSELAQSGLAGVNDLIIVNQATLTLEPASVNDEVTMVVTVEESKPFFFKSDSTLERPSALQGSARPVTVEPITNKARGISPGVRFGVTNLGGNNQALTLGIEAGENNLGLDIDYRKFIRHDTGYAVNFFNRRSTESEFDGGERNVDLANGNTPWVHRIGAGVELFRPIAKDFQAALGITYQLVSVRDDVFSDNLNNIDELGNTLTFSDDRQDELLTINLATALDRRNNTKNPTKGYRLLLQTDQSIPVGEANIGFNRLSANYTHYLPLPLFGFKKGDRTLALNLQGGTIIGDAPGYEAFSLGGSKSVRGYRRGEVGTGRSFVQATAEYRFPLFSVNAFKQEMDVAGTLFIDYATDLGSGDTVTGQPAVVRDKPGDGFGYGFGLRTLTPVGIVKLEFALNDDGDSEVIFNIGDRF